MITKEVIDSIYINYEFQVKSLLIIVDKIRGFSSDSLERNRVDTNIATKQIITKNKYIDIIIDIR
jgi:hypothetical protein